VSIKNEYLEFTEENYLIATKQFVGLFNKKDEYYIIYNDNCKITLDKYSYNIIKDLKTKNISEIFKLYDNRAKILIQNLIDDELFLYCTKPQNFTIFESNIITPDILDLQITDICNMCCKTCYSDIRNKNVSLSFKKIKEILIDAKNQGISFISITGGEPTLHPELSKIIHYIKQNGFYVHMNINGSVLNSEIINLLKLVNGFGVSLDSVDDLEFKIIRGKPLLKDTIKNIKKLVSEDLSFNIVTVVTAKNKLSLDNLFKVIIDLGVKRIKLNYFLPIGRGAKNTDLDISYTDYITIYNQLISKYSDKIEILKDSNLFYFRFSNINNKIVLIPNTISCGAYTRRLAIKNNGDVVGCLLLSLNTDIIANIYKKSLSDIIKFDLQKYILKKEYCKLNTNYCKECINQKYCGLGCLAFYVTGKGILDPRCEQIENGNK